MITRKVLVYGNPNWASRRVRSGNHLRKSFSSKMATAPHEIEPQTQCSLLFNTRPIFSYCFGFNYCRFRKE